MLALGVVLAITEIITNLIHENKSLINFSFYIIAFLWPLIISITIKSINDVKKFLKFYAWIKLILIGVIGSLIYFYFSNVATLVFNYLNALSGTPDDTNFSFETGGRLVSIVSINSADAAFFLVSAFAIFYYDYYNSKSSMKLILVFLSLFFIILTWTRTAVILLFLFLVLFHIKIKKNISSKLIPIFFMGAIIAAVFLFNLERIKSDERLNSNGNLVARFDQYDGYLKNIFQLPFFYGANPEEDIAAKFKLKNIISAESYFLMSFTRYGILSGLLVTLFFVIVIINYSKNIRKTQLLLGRQNKDFIFIVMLFYLLFVMTLFAATTLLVDNALLWILIGLLSTTYQSIYISNPLQLNLKHR